MFLATTLVSAVAIFSASVQAAEAQTSDFKVNTPKITASCKPLNLTWEKTHPPYNLIIVHSNDPCGPIIADLGDHKTNHFLWNTYVPAGNYSLSIEDAKGNEGWSAKFEVKKNTLNTTCKFSTAYNSNATNVVQIPGDASPAGAAGSTPSDDSTPGPVGAVGGSVVGAASSMRQYSASAVAAAALVGAIAFSL